MNVRNMTTQQLAALHTEVQEECARRRPELLLRREFLCGKIEGFNEAIKIYEDGLEEKEGPALPPEAYVGEKL